MSSQLDDKNPWSIFLVFLRLGLTSFGGPIAHLAYFRAEFVSRRQWLSEQSYSSLVALCQFLPGPASSQVGIALGLSRAGYAGAFSAWLGFTLPSALALIVFAVSLTHYAEVLSVDAFNGLKIVAIAVVAQAVWGMARNLCPDVLRITMMAMTSCFVLLIPSAFTQISIIVVAGVFGFLFIRLDKQPSPKPLIIGLSPRSGYIWLGIFFLLLFGLPAAAALFSNPILSVIDVFFRAGSLVFGGGHVVLPLLQSEVVSHGWVTNDVFLAGYGATQAVPGPLFTFAAFIGASMDLGPANWYIGIVCLVAIFVPSFLLVAGSLPFWESFRKNVRAQSALAGINASVVGILLAALYQPIWTSAVHSVNDVVLAFLAFIALVFWKIPPWLVVISCAIVGWLMIVFA